MRRSARILAMLLGLSALAAAEDVAAAARRAGLQVQVDSGLGMATWIAGTDRVLATPVQAQAWAAARGKGVADAGDQVRAFIAQHHALFGGDGDLLADADLVRDATSPSGLRTLVWQQRLAGIRVHDGLLSANLGGGERLVSLGGRMLPQGRARARTWVVKPTVSAAQALARILDRGDMPAVLVRSDEAEQGQTLGGAGLLGEATAHLAWIVHDRDRIDLTWVLTYVRADDGIMYQTVVDADGGKPLALHRLTTPDFAPAERLAAAFAEAQGGAALAKATPPVTAPPASLATNIALRVFADESPRPLSPGWPSASGSQPPEVARTLVELESINATASPDGWVSGAGPTFQTIGNNVAAHLDLDANNVADTPRPTSTSGTPPTFDFSLDLSLAPSTYRDAAVTNLFYWCNFAHDRLYTYGFDEASGNFQTSNFGKGGTGNDAVLADAQDGSGTNNANFATPSDGTAPRMQMFIFTAPNPDRDSSFDATVVLHEYAHGLSNRLVGGTSVIALSALQSGGLGEGWSDFIAIALLSDPADDPLGTYPVGAYLTQNYFRGIRRYPYVVEPAATVSGASLNPLTLSDISVNSGVHDQGEVWCQTLWDCRGEFITRYGAATGNETFLQLVVDAMKLTPANPSFTTARDAILAADTATHAAANHDILWAAFAKRGLGRDAVAGDSDSVEGVVQSFEKGDSFWVTNAAGITATGQEGGPFTLSATSFTLTNPTGGPINWTASGNQGYASLSPSSGTIAAGGQAVVTIGTQVAMTGLGEGSHLETLTFSDTTNGKNVTRPFRTLIRNPYIKTTETFAWIDPTGHADLGLDDDDFTPPEALGFTFDFYGVDHSDLRVTSNGFLCFDAPTDLFIHANNGTIPSPSLPNEIIAPWWDDLDPSAGGAVRFAILDSAPNRRVVITWDGVPHYNNAGSNPVSFQVILEEATQDIVFQYQTVQTGDTTYGRGRSATIGVEDESGAYATVHSLNGSTLLSTNTAFRFSRPMTDPPIITNLTASPPALGGSTSDLTVTATDGGGEPALTYLWNVQGTPPAAVTFSANASNGAKATTATFSVDGTYTLRVRAIDGDGESDAADVLVTISGVGGGGGGGIINAGGGGGGSGCGSGGSAFAFILALAGILRWRRRL